MIMTREGFAGFAPRPVGHPDRETSVPVALPRSDRNAVDRMAEAAQARGVTDTGRTVAVEGGMFGRGFGDPDGNVIEPMWMAKAK